MSLKERADVWNVLRQKPWTVRGFRRFSEAGLRTSELVGEDGPEKVTLKSADKRPWMLC